MAGTNPFFTMSKNILASHANDRQNLSRLDGSLDLQRPDALKRLCKLIGLCKLICMRSRLQVPAGRPFPRRPFPRRPFPRRPFPRRPFPRRSVSALEGSQHLVEPDGIEPTTSCLQSRRSPN